MGPLTRGLHKGQVSQSGWTEESGKHVNLGVESQTTETENLETHESEYGGQRGREKALRFSEVARAVKVSSTAFQSEQYCSMQSDFHLAWAQRTFNAIPKVDSW